MKSRFEYEAFLISAWNDYISEVDDPPKDAETIEEVDLKLEGFYQRFQEDIDEYEVLMTEYTKYLIENKL